jgi:hypothetical protein
MLERLFVTIFVILAAIQVGIAVATTVCVAMFIDLLWERSPVRAVIAIVGLIVVILGLVRSWRREGGGDHGDVHPGPSMSRIPLSGSMGGIYLLQFLVWALVIPGVGIFYLILLAGGLLFVPVVIYANRSSRRRAGQLASGGLAVVICALLAVSVAAARELALAGLFGMAVLGGVMAGAALVALRRRQKHPTIAQYR